MSCPTCKPVNLGPNGFPQGFTQEQPLVLKKECVAGNAGAIYCLVDNNNGTAYINSSNGGQISAPFAVGYNAEIKATDTDAEGYERIYVTTYLSGDVTYRVDARIDSSPSDSNNDEWKKITGIKVPYDLDLDFFLRRRLQRHQLVLSRRSS